MDILKDLTLLNYLLIFNNTDSITFNLKSRRLTNYFLYIWHIITSLDATAVMKSTNKLIANDPMVSCTAIA